MLTDEELDRLEASAERNGVFGAGALKLTTEIRRLRARMERYEIALRSIERDTKYPETAIATASAALVNPVSGEVMPGGDA